MGNHFSVKGNDNRHLVLFIADCRRGGRQRNFSARKSALRYRSVNFQSRRHTRVNKNRPVDESSISRIVPYGISNDIFSFFIERKTVKIVCESFRIGRFYSNDDFFRRNISVQFIGSGYVFFGNQNKITRIYDFVSRSDIPFQPGCSDIGQDRNFTRNSVGIIQHESFTDLCEIDFFRLLAVQSHFFENIFFHGGKETDIARTQPFIEHYMFFVVIVFLRSLQFFFLYPVENCGIRFALFGGQRFPRNIQPRHLRHRQRSAFRRVLDDDFYGISSFETVKSV